MAVPKRKRSRSNTHSRRAQHDRLDKVQFILCPNCKEPTLPHRVCAACGKYEGRDVLEIQE